MPKLIKEPVQTVRPLPDPRLVSKEEYLNEALRIWKRANRDAKPKSERKKRGRHAERGENREAIAEIAKVNAGISSPGIEIWTQSNWVKKIGIQKGVAEPGKVTIKNYLKEYIDDVPLPIHLIPASVVQVKPLNDQLQHWFGVALLTVLASVNDSRSSILSFPFSDVDAIHRKLCTKHILRAIRPPEGERLAWLQNQWKISSAPVKITSRTSHPARSR